MKSFRTNLVVMVLVAFAASAVTYAAHHEKWEVHDMKRPVPPVVTPGKTAADPPSDAIVLFDGSNLDGWTGRGGSANWKLEDGYMEVNGTGDISTRQAFGDLQVHLEFATPEKVVGDSQGRGNSGLFLMGMYEVQILDSYDNRTYADGQAAALYGQFPPLVNACRKPGEWQTYDVIFRAPTYEEGKVVTPARVTVIHNGVVVQNAREFLGRSSHKQRASYRPHAEKLPIRLQDHGNPMRFRNIWVRELKDTE